MFTTDNTKTSDPRFFYRFLITRNDGETCAVVISEDGQFLSEPECSGGFDLEMEAAPLQS